MANSYIHDGNPLHDARQFRNSLARVQELLETGANANYQYGGYTVLHSACIRGDLELATLLVDYGADIHARHPDHHRTPLLLACIDEDYLEARAPTDLIKMLVEKGADPNDEDHQCFTALKYLITVKPFDTTILELMQFLINNGADVDIQGEFDRATALHWAFVCKTPLEAVKLLIENGADIHVKDKYGRTPLHKACHFHNLEGAQLLVKHGADVLDQNYTGLMTPLHYACRLNAWREACRRNAWRETRSSWSDTPLDARREYARADVLLQLEVIKLLIDKGADIHAKDKRGWTPLHWACHEGRLEVVELLMSRGANANAKTNAGLRPLQIASQQNHQSVVWWLVRFYPSLVLEQYE